VPFEDATAAHRAMHERGHFGKLVLVIDAAEAGR
jgi:hypothetical protein